MKKLISTALSLVIICTAFSCVGFTAGAADAVEPQNGIISPIGSDSGFEDENAFIPLMKNSNLLSITSETGHNSQKSLKYTGNGGWNEVAMANFRVQDNCDYVLSFWYKGGNWNNPNFNMFRAEFENDSYNRIWTSEISTIATQTFLNKDASPDDNWKKVTVKFNTSAYNNSEFVQFYFNGANQDFYIDDLCMVKVSGDDDVVFPLGTFPGYEGQNFLPSLYRGEKVAVTDSVSHNGSKSLCVNQGENNEAGIAALYTEAGNTYAIKFWCRGGKTWTSLHLYPAVDKGNYSYDKGSEADKIASYWNISGTESNKLDEWKYKEIKYEAKTTGYIMLYAHGLSSDFENTFYIDDLRAVKETPDTEGNLITNGRFDFQYGWFADGWSYSTENWWGYAPAYNDVDHTTCLHLTSPGYWGISYGTRFNAEEDANYEISFKYKGNLAGSGYKLLKADETVVAEKWIGNNSDSWQTYTMRFNSEKLLGENGIFLFNVAPNANFYVDDIKLVKLSDSKLDINGDGVSDILDLVQFKNNGYSSELKAELRTVILAQ